MTVSGSLVRSMRVEHRTALADGVVGLTLTRTDGCALPKWTPGAHIDIELTDGVVRQYSLCGPVDDRSRWQVAIQREANGRGGSLFAYDHLWEGAQIRVSEPRNHFRLEDSPSYLFIAGGIGITPLVPMISHVAQTDSQWRLIYGGRRSATMAFGEELVGRFAENVTLVPEDTAGLLPLGSLLGSAEPDTLVYCCGPEGLISAVEAHCTAWPAGALHTERFAAKPVDSPFEDTAFEVELAHSGQTIRVPADVTLLEALSRCGVDLPSACEEGICGTCETGVISGVVDHRDSVLTDEERETGKTMFPCISRSAGPRLVLDL